MTIESRFALTLVATISLLGAGPALAENAVVADPDHYKVELENDSVRVVRVKYGPGEKSVMHDHDDYVVVYLTDAKGKFTMPDGSTEYGMVTPVSERIPVRVRVNRFTF